MHVHKCRHSYYIQYTFILLSHTRHSYYIQYTFILLSHTRHYRNMWSRSKIALLLVHYWQIKWCTIYVTLYCKSIVISISNKVNCYGALLYHIAPRSIWPPFILEGQNCDRVDHYKRCRGRHLHFLVIVEEVLSAPRTTPCCSYVSAALLPLV